MKKKKYKNYKKESSLSIYVTAVMLGAYLEDIAVNYAVYMRGFIAFGGEYCIIPLCVMLAVILNWAIDTVDEKISETENRKDEKNENKSV